MWPGAGCATGAAARSNSRFAIPMAIFSSSPRRSLPTDKKRSLLCRCRCRRGGRWRLRGREFRRRNRSLPPVQRAAPGQIGAEQGGEEDRGENQRFGGDGGGIGLGIIFRGGGAMAGAADPVAELAGQRRAVEP